jgi:hypothetical protein
MGGINIGPATYGHAPCILSGMRLVTLFFVAALLPISSAAQDTQDAQTSSTSAGDLEKLPIPSWGKAIIDSFSEPVHPVIGGVAAGGGLGFGVGYESPDEGRWYRQAEAMITVRRYWAMEGEVGRRSTSKRSQLGVFGGVRDMNRIDFFGIGPRSVFEDRAAYGLRETTIGTRGWHRPTRAVRVGGGAALYMPAVGRGANGAIPSIEERFAQSTIPGFSAEHTFGRYRGFVDYTYPALADGQVDNADTYRGAYQVALEVVRDYDERQHDFHRWETEVQQRIPGFTPGQRLTLHGFLATTNTGADVPFYMLYTLGGSGGLKAFRPDLLGTDGTRATLRGFRNYRFRDRDLVLMQAEYRIPLTRHVHSTVFVDTGQVAPRRSQLFKDLKTSTGFSLSYMRNGRTLGRMDVGFGGGEGIQLFWSFGTFQN